MMQWLPTQEADGRFRTPFRQRQDHTKLRNARHKSTALAPRLHANGGCSLQQKFCCSLYVASVTYRRGVYLVLQVLRFGHAEVATSSNVGGKDMQGKMDWKRRSHLAMH
jgi:hypothetical protein